VINLSADLLFAAAIIDLILAMIVVICLGVTAWYIVQLESINDKVQYISETLHYMSTQLPQPKQQQLIQQPAPQSVQPVPQQPAPQPVYPTPPMMPQYPPR
jgi:hypothetical protein